MTKAVSTKEAKDNLSSLIGWVHEHEDEVIVESRGKPRAVIMAFKEYEKLYALRAQQRRQEALATMRRLRAEVTAHNSELTVTEADELAERATRDAIQGLMEKGKVRFEQDQI